MQTKVVVGTAGFTMSTIDKFPANANPYQYDIGRMGTPIGTNVEIMYDHHDVNDYIVVVHKPTGKRVRITMPGILAQEENATMPRVVEEALAIDERTEELLKKETLNDCVSP